MASSRSALTALLVAVSCAAAASATTYTVGDNQGWTANVDYTAAGPEGRTSRSETSLCSATPAGRTL